MIPLRRDETITHRPQDPRGALRQRNPGITVRDRTLHHCTILRPGTRNVNTISSIQQKAITDPPLQQNASGKAVHPTPQRQRSGHRNLAPGVPGQKHEDGPHVPHWPLQATHILQSHKVAHRHAQRALPKPMKTPPRSDTFEFRRVRNPGLPRDDVHPGIGGPNHQISPDYLGASTTIPGAGAPLQLQRRRVDGGKPRTPPRHTKPAVPAEQTTCRPATAPQGHRGPRRTRSAPTRKGPDGPRSAPR
eukprot:gene2702-biopygen3552